MIDWHIHIGQFHRFYFDPFAVFSALKSNGIDECYFSSTTSCIYCRESEAVKNGLVNAEMQPTAQELNKIISDEIQTASKAAAELGIKAHPLYWVVPELIGADVNIETIFHEADYCGFKIHPRAQQWDEKNPEHCRLLHLIFNEANRHCLTILIHTGIDEIDSPDRFERLIQTASKADIILAHIKNPECMSRMLNKYRQVKADFSCTSFETVALMQQCFSKERLLFGTDFPASLAFATVADSLPDMPTQELLTSLYSDEIRKFKDAMW